MPVPHIYINVHQTIFAGLAALTLTAYITDFKGFRSSINDLFTGN